MIGTMAGKIFTTLALMPVIAVAQGTNAARPISIDDAVRLAQKNQPTTVLARNSVRLNESNVRTSKLAFRPDPESLRQSDNVATFPPHTRSNRGNPNAA